MNLGMVEESHKDVLIGLKFDPKSDEVQKELNRRNVLPCFVGKVE